MANRKTTCALLWNDHSWQVRSEAKTFWFFFFSLFVLLKGRSKEEAFRLGYEMCEAVTADNPKPVKLKFEKVRKSWAKKTISSNDAQLSNLFLFSKTELGQIIFFLFWSGLFALRPASQEALRWLHVRDARAERAGVWRKGNRNRPKRWLSCCCKGN